MAEQTRRVFTIGHSTRSVEELIALLADSSIAELADVRRFPGSRRNPQFGQEALDSALSEAGIAYRHYAGLGGRRGSPSPASANIGWRVASFRAYADYMATPGWIGAFEALKERAETVPVAYMCAEAAPWRCHRRLISDAFVAAGWEVLHILGKDRLSPHVLPPFAEVNPLGALSYPGTDEAEPPSGSSADDGDKPPV